MMWDKNPAWTERLREYVEKSPRSFAQTAADINAEFGTTFTRCACIGRATRLGLHIPENKRHALIMHNADKRRTPDSARSKRISLKKLFGLIPDDTLPPDESPCAVALVDAKNDQCRWPLGEPKDMMFCGAQKVEGYPYCARHALIAYDPVNRAPTLYFRPSYIKRAA